MSDLSFTNEELKKIVHDLRSPLSLIYTSADLLLGDIIGSLNTDQKEVVEKVFSQSDKGLKFIDEKLGNLIDDI